MAVNLMFYLHYKSLSLNLVSLVVLMSVPAQSEDWGHWRGPTRDGVSAEASGWNGKTWLQGELWRASVGEGSSSPLIVGNLIYLIGWSNNQDIIYCLDASTGKEKWRQSYNSPRYGRVAVGDQVLYSGPCSTPEYDSQSGLLCTLSADGDLTTWDTNNNGQRVWTLNLYDRYQAARRPEVAKRRKTQRDYGYTSSPLAINGQLIVEVGGNKGNLVAFDIQNGHELWHSESLDEAGHTGGPVPIKIDGVPCVVVLTLRNLVVTRVDGKNAGKTVAVYPWTTDFANNIATPAVFGDSVIITSSYNQSAMCRLQVTLRGATKIWESNEFASGVCSPIIYEGRVYWAWRGVHCVDFDTGNELWTGGKVGSQGSCIMTSDERLIVYANKGTLSLVDSAKHSPNEYRELSVKTVLSKTDAWPHVVLAGGRLYCRDREGNIRCLEVSLKSATEAN